MSAFTSYHHPPFLVDSLIMPPKPHTPIYGHEILPLHTLNLNQIDPLSNMQICDENVSSLEQQRTDSFASMVEQNTNDLGIIVDKKRRIGNGFSSNSANSKDVIKQVKSKKEKKDKEGIKDKKKKGNQGSEQPPKEYIHVRARRGQATDSHSLAERVRREKISERMKTLQALVPGCDKVTGKAMMLDEIINYVQSLQNQVEFLSMKLTSLDPMMYTFGLMDLDALSTGFEGLYNNMGSPMSPLVQSSTTTTSSSTTGSGRQLLALPDANAMINLTTTTFPCTTSDNSDQKLLLPTQEGRSSYWPWGVLDEEQRQSNNIINQYY